MDIRRVDQSYTAPISTGAQPKREAQPAGPQVTDQVSVGSSTPEEPKVPKKWTFMHYNAADNNLKEYMVHDANEMERVGSTKNMNLLTMLDQGGDNCKLYYLERDNNIARLESPVVKDYGNTDMANPKTLTDFITLCMEKYPAEHYCLILADHGDGWKGAISDDTSKTWMSLPTIRQALEDAQAKTGKKIDVLGFDACLMATGEVAYELKDVAHYMVGSQETEAGDGWPYTPLLSGPALKKLARALGSRLDIEPKELAKKMVTNAAENAGESIPTLSAYDLTKMGSYETAVNTFADALLATTTPNGVLKNISRQTQCFDGDNSNSRDQYHFAELIANSPEVTDQALKDAAKGMMKVLAEEVIIQNQHSKEYPNAHGMTIEITGTVNTGKEYKDLKFAQNTQWDEAVQKFRQGNKKTLQA